MGPVTPPEMWRSLGATTAAYLGLELCWFSWALSRVYRPAFAAMQGLTPATNPFRAAYAPPAYAALVGALWFFAVLPSATRAAAAGRATLLAAAVYGVYNATNLATLSRYPTRVAALDCAWGLLSFNLAAQAGVTWGAARLGPHL